VCLITFDTFLTNVKLFHVYIKVHNTANDIGHTPAIRNIFNTDNVTSGEKNITDGRCVPNITGCVVNFKINMK
jgi:pterin-4a-carbinolamine dehydratase